MYLHRPTTESNSLAKVVCPCDVAIERLGIELGEDVDLVDLAVYAVAHRDVDEPVASPDGHLKRERRQLNHYYTVITTFTAQSVSRLQRESATANPKFVRTSESRMTKRDFVRGGDYRGLGSGPREREEARTSATAEDDGGHRVRADVPPRHRRRLSARVRLLLLAHRRQPENVIDPP